MTLSRIRGASYSIHFDAPPSYNDRRPSRKPFNPADSGTADTDEGLRHQIPPAMAAEGYHRGGPPEREALDGREGHRPPPDRHRLHRRRPLRPRRRLVLRRDAQQPRRGMAPRRRRCAAHGQVRGGPPPGAAHHSGYPHRVRHGERPDKSVRHPCRHPRPGALQSVGGVHPLVQGHARGAPGPRYRPQAHERGEGGPHDRALPDRRRKGHD